MEADAVKQKNLEEAQYGDNNFWKVGEDDTSYNVDDLLRDLEDEDDDSSPGTASASGGAAAGGSDAIDSAD